MEGQTPEKKAQKDVKLTCSKGVPPNWHTFTVLTNFLRKEKSNSNVAVTELAHNHFNKTGRNVLKSESSPMLSESNSAVHGLIMLLEQLKSSASAKGLPQSLIKTRNYSVTSSPILLKTNFQFFLLCQHWLSFKWCSLILPVICLQRALMHFPTLHPSCAPLIPLRQRFFL